MMVSTIKWHGGKHYLAKRIVELMPSHIHYNEPYFGSGAVLFEKDPEKTSEVINDVDSSLTNFWQVLQEPNYFKEFKRRVEAIPFSEVEYNKACNQSILLAGCIEQAVVFFVRCRQSMAGRMKSFAPISRTRVRRGMNEQASAWLSSIEALPQVHARLMRVVILNKDATEEMRQQDGPKTLHYLDPPYLDSTRTAKDVYKHEMTEDQHSQMLDTVTNLKGMVMISGYDNELYNSRLSGWKTCLFDLPNNASSDKTKRRMIEKLWCNFLLKRS